jgi:hypothetical protein
MLTDSIDTSCPLWLTGPQPGDKSCKDVMIESGGVNSM